MACHPLQQMMENAGRWLAETVRRGAGSGTVVVYAGFDVTVVLAVARDRLGPVPPHQLAIIERVGLGIDTPAPVAGTAPPSVLMPVAGCVPPALLS